MLDIGSQVSDLVLNLAMGYTIGTLIALIALPLTKISDGKLSERFVTLVAVFDMLVGTGIGVVILSNSIGSTLIWIDIFSTTGALLLGYAMRYRTHLDIRKHLDR
jgi:hypothetical protein